MTPEEFADLIAAVLDEDDDLEDEGELFAVRPLARLHGHAVTVDYSMPYSTPQGRVHARFVGGRWRCSPLLERLLRGVMTTESALATAGDLDGPAVWCWRMKAMDLRVSDEAVAAARAEESKTTRRG